MNIQPIFSNFYAEEKLQIDNKSLKDFCYKQLSEDKGISLSNVGGWHSSFLDPFIPELKELTIKVQEALDNVCNTIQYGIMAKPNNAFINISKKGNYHKFHDHPGSFLSCVYYVDAHPSKGNIVFSNGNKMLTWHQNCANIKEYNIYNSSTWTVNSHTGTLLVFPAWLDHEVLENLTDEDRISIVYNCESL